MTDLSTREAEHSPDDARHDLLGAVVLSLLILGLLVGGTLLTASVQAHGRFFHRGHHDPEAMHERAELFADWILSRVDATDEQRAEVLAVLDRTIDELAELRTAHRALHGAVVSELTRPEIDRSSLEALRVEQLGAFDEASRRIVLALADIADVLTQEQREELAEFAERFHRWHR